MATLSADQENYLRTIYFDPSHVVSYQSPYRLFKFVRQDGRYQIKFDLIKKWLNNQASYSLNKNVMRTFHRGRVLVTGIDDQWDADLISLIPYGNYNDGHEYILCVIDIFSRYAWVIPMKTKTTKETCNSFKQIVQQGRKPRRLRTDAGAEFKGGTFKKCMQDLDIHHFFTHNEKQANYVERFIQTLKKKIFRFMKGRNTKRYIDDLQKFVQAYNRTFHSGIQAVPEDVDKTNERKLWWQMFWPLDDPPQAGKKRKKKRKQPFLFKVGDHVRMSLIRTAFHREYHERWSTEIFIIRERFHRQGQALYKLMDWMKENLDGTFYQAELQITHNPPVFNISEQIKERGRGARREVFVSWEGWPKKFNEWILKSSIQAI